MLTDRSGTRIAAAIYTVPVSKRYLVQTFGCQMNEHDSERLAGHPRGRRVRTDQRSDPSRRHRPEHLLHS